jgi:hypothetical protein
MRPLLRLSIISIINRWYPHCGAIGVSWMISHRCSSRKYEYCLFNYFISSLYILPNSTLPDGEVEVAIWLFYKIDFSRLSNPLWQITKSTGPSCQVHISKPAFPSYQFQTTKATLPNCQVQICFLNCPHHKKIMGCALSEFFQVCWNFYPKKSDPFKIQTTL